jgi:hypothetical protein
MTSTTEKITDKLLDESTKQSLMSSIRGKVIVDAGILVSTSPVFSRRCLYLFYDG